MTSTHRAKWIFTSQDLVMPIPSLSFFIFLFSSLSSTICLGGFFFYFLELFPGVGKNILGVFFFWGLETVVEIRTFVGILLKQV